MEPQHYHALQAKILLGFILLAILTRLATFHLPNVSPINAMALFYGAYFNRRWVAFVMILLSLGISDFILNKTLLGYGTFFYSGFYWQYGCYLLITCLGSALKKKVKIIHLFFVSVSASILFFIMSNFGVWYSSPLYPSTLEGLIECYTAAIPFFKNTIISDLLFSGLFFGLFEVRLAYENQWRKRNHRQPLHRNL